MLCYGKPTSDHFQKQYSRKVDEAFFILYENNGKYLIEAKNEKGFLIGKYINLNNEIDAGPWVGKIVSKDRIDGNGLS